VKPPTRQTQDTLPFPAEVHPAAAVHALLASLLERAFRSPGSGAHEHTLSYSLQQFAQLQLAEAALRCSALSAEARRRPPQLAVLGPTQTGKSTIVNLLFGRQLAEVSPLAGFTVHPQAFAPSDLLEPLPWIDQLFPGWQRVSPSQLDRAQLASYSLTSTDSPPAVPADLPRAVIWDTPDFDSLAAHTYERGVLEVAALADAFLLVLSREKYSDLTVWRMLQLLEPLGRPLVIALNKVTPDSLELLTASLRERLREHAPTWRDAPLVTLEYIPAPGPTSPQDLPDATAALRSAVTNALTATSAARGSTGILRFLRCHWRAWLQPVHNEHAVIVEWNNLVRTALDSFVASYRRDYLDHPHRYDTFRRATAELLHLLELPGVGAALSFARQIVTWPARHLLNASREWWQRRRAPAAHRLNNEAAILSDLVDSLLTTLRTEVARRDEPGTPSLLVWRALAQRLREREPALREKFQSAARDHQAEVNRQVQTTADQLYQKLQQRPAVLNTLRAARVTTDAASIALAVKTGGMHPNDLLLAPAMFAVTSLLTEGALGTYMRRVAEELKRRQLEHVRATLVDAVLHADLRSAADDLHAEGLLSIAPDQVAAAENALDAWERADAR